MSVRITFTKELPTEPGRYVHRDPQASWATAVIIEVESVHGKPRAFWGSGMKCMSEIGGEWCGPLIEGEPAAGPTIPPAVIDALNAARKELGDSYEKSRTDGRSAGDAYAQGQWRGITDAIKIVARFVGEPLAGPSAGVPADQFSEFQRRATVLAEQAWPSDSIDVRTRDAKFAHLMEECGELYGAARSFDGRSLRPDKTGTKEDILDELGDVGVLWLRIAEHYGLSASDGIERALAKFQRRLDAKNGNPITPAPAPPAGPGEPKPGEAGSQEIFAMFSPSGLFTFARNTEADCWARLCELQDTTVAVLKKRGYRAVRGSFVGDTPPVVDEGSRPAGLQEIFVAIGETSRPAGSQEGSVGGDEASDLEAIHELALIAEDYLCSVLPSASDKARLSCDAELGIWRRFVAAAPHLRLPRTIGEASGESCSRCGRANTWHPDCPTCHRIAELEQKIAKTSPPQPLGLPSREELAKVLYQKRKAVCPDRIEKWWSELYYREKDKYLAMADAVLALLAERGGEQKAVVVPGTATRITVGEVDGVPYLYSENEQMEQAFAWVDRDGLHINATWAAEHWGIACDGEGIMVHHLCGEQPQPVVYGVPWEVCEGVYGLACVYSGRSPGSQASQEQLNAFCSAYEAARRNATENPLKGEVERLTKT